MGELGRGGMGVVYKARQIKANRVVALKMLLSGAHANKDELSRFQREAEAVAQLQHPNIVQMYDIGEHAGLPFFSMEFVDGGGLHKRLTHAVLSPLEAGALVETLARAIHAAHEAGIVHRDLKPANILLSRQRRSGNDSNNRLPLGKPKITDFGLAKKLEGETALTTSGTIMGTPTYMAPEQAAGNSKLVGPAADVYSLGAILYECLTGRPPFRANSSTGNHPSGR